MLDHKYIRLFRTVIGAIFISALLAARPAPAAIDADKDTAVIFVYQRVGEDSVPQGNISIEQFKQHITELERGGYSVLSLPKIVDALKKGDALPPKTVAITFEGAYQATLVNAMPVLEDANMPFTVFFAPDMADENAPPHMNWKQLRKLKKDGLVTLGILPASYEHMVNLTAGQNAALINRAVSKYRDAFGEPPEFFAYPYGEYSDALKKQVAGYSFKAAFGQQSGAAYPGSDFMALPRFPMTDEYGDLDRFMLTANALPLPVSGVVPENAIITQNPPVIGFTVMPEIKNLSKLSCFASSLGKLPLIHLGGGRVEIRLKEPLADRRTRINCTLPNSTVTPGEPRAWRWFGMQLILPSLDEDSGDDPADSSEDQ